MKMERYCPASFSKLNTQMYGNPGSQKNIKIPDKIFIFSKPEQSRSKQHTSSTILDFGRVKLVTKKGRHADQSSRVTQRPRRSRENLARLLVSYILTITVKLIKRYSAVNQVL